MGWFIRSSGKESNYSNVLLTAAAINTYEELCSLDVLGLSDTHHLSKPDNVVLEKFKSQLTPDEKDVMRQGLFGKKDKANTKNNKARSLG